VVSAALVCEPWSADWFAAVLASAEIADQFSNLVEAEDWLCCVVGVAAGMCELSRLHNDPALAAGEAGAVRGHLGVLVKIIREVLVKIIREMRLWGGVVAKFHPIGQNSSFGPKTNSLIYKENKQTLRCYIRSCFAGWGGKVPPLHP
jgi:hypothetical protein